MAGTEVQPAKIARREIDIAVRSPFTQNPNCLPSLRLVRGMQTLEVKGFHMLRPALFEEHFRILPCWPIE